METLPTPPIPEPSFISPPVVVGGPAEAPGATLNPAASPPALPRYRVWHRRHWAAWLALFGLAFSLRLSQLATLPPHNATADEYGWTWAGMTLLDSGRPASWSWLKPYERQRIWLHWRGADYPMAAPWMDNPPLFYVLMGAWMHASGTRDPLAVDLEQMRRAVLLLFVAQFACFTLVLRQLLRPLPALVTLLLFATATPAVIQQRLVVSEALWVPLALAAYALQLWWLRRGGRGRLLGLALLAALLPLTKLPALGFTGFLALLALRRKQPPLLWALGLGSACGLLAYVAYSFAVAGPFFLEVLAAQGARFCGFAGFFYVLVRPRLMVVGVPYTPFLLAGAWCLVLSASRRGQEWALAVPVYVAGLALLANQEEIYSWYCLPLYPFFCIALGELFRRGHRHNPRAAWLLGLVALVEWWLVLVDRELIGAQPARLPYLATLAALTLLLLPDSALARRAARPCAALAVSLLALAGGLQALLR